MEEIKMKKKCPCCGFRTLNEIGEYEICPVCYWEDDSIQREDINYEGGANTVSLKVARENFKKIGASEYIYINKVRLPLEKEKENL